MSYSKRCKDNGIQLELNWFNARKRWKTSKGYTDGFPIFYSKGEATRHDTKAGYEAALHEWVIEQAKRNATRPHAAVWHHHQTLFEQVRNCCFEPQLSKDVSKFLDSVSKVLAQPELPERIGVGGLTKRFKAEFCGYEATTKTGEEAMLPTAMGGNDFGSLSYRLPDKWVHLIELHSTTGVNRPQTIKYWAERYLRKLQEKASVNQRSDETYKDVRQKIGIFRSYVGDESHIKSITGVRWEDYYQWLLIQRTDIVATTKGNYRNAARTFLKWAWRQDECELTELPNNIDDRAMNFIDIGVDDDDDIDGEDDSNPRLFWEKSDLLKAINSNDINDYFKCWILLMLNCGFTQTDINDIRHRQLKLSERRLIHKRTKTKRTPNPPKVNYLLWDSTVEAIEKVMTKEGKWAFLTARGARLCPRKTVEVDGELKTTSYDNVSKHWQQMKKAKKIMPDKQLKGLRKTGAATVKEYSLEMRGLYLGHVGGIADKHYDPKSGKIYKPLDDAIQYLGWQYGQCEAPALKRELTPEMILTLQEAGYDMSE